MDSKVVKGWADCSNARIGVAWEIGDASGSSRNAHSFDDSQTRASYLDLDAIK